MKTLRLLMASLALALAGGYAFAAEPVPWKHQDYLPQFRFFFENKTFNAESWTALSPEEQLSRLGEAREPALARQEAMQRFYEDAMRPWDTAQLRDYAAKTTEGHVSLVRLWLGEEAGAAFRAKLRITRAMLNKAPSEGLTDSDAAALRPYLTAGAIADLRALKAAESMRQELGKKKDGPSRQEQMGERLDGVSGSVGPDGGKIDRFFDGSNGSGDVAGGQAFKAYEIPKGAINQTVAGASAGLGASVAAGARGALNAQPRGTAASTIKSATPEPPSGAAAKSTSWTSDAYGYTVNTADGRTLTYRSQREAEAAIRAMPNGSVSRITLYGHGSPGAQTVGDAYYEAGDAADLLRGKMAPGGVIQFTGCNTASIGDATLNPAVGISMLTRRLMYFSIPYWQDRLSGVPADQARRQWDSTWNADLSRDTSLQMRGTTVCGYRTFGLVPGRLPVVTRIAGNQEATSPGYVAGKKVCYLNGREVPEP